MGTTPDQSVNSLLAAFPPPEWLRIAPLLEEVDLPLGLVLHLDDAPSSSCTDHGLMRVLRRYDREPRPFLEELEDNTVFRFNGKIFVKGRQMRKRFRCRCLNNRRIYLIDPTAEVHLEHALASRRAS